MLGLTVTNDELLGYHGLSWNYRGNDESPQNEPRKAPKNDYGPYCVYSKPRFIGVTKRRKEAPEEY